MTRNGTGAGPLFASGPRSGAWTGRSRASSGASKLGISPATPGSRDGGGGTQSNGRTKTAPVGTRSRTPRSPVSTSRESGTSASTSTGSSRGRVKTITAKREGDRWYVVLSCDDVPAEPLAPTNSTAGIDLGLVSFLTTSDGTHIANPRHLAANTERLTAAQRALSRKKRGSGRREKAVRKITRLHGKVRRQRLDHAHKTALMLVREYGSIVHEKLQIANMTSRP